MTEWDYLTDLLVVGSGGGLTGAVTAAASGLNVVIAEKSNLVGGSTAMSGGVIWLPNNPLMAEQGVEDSFEKGLDYFESVVGPPTPASSLERREAYLEQGSAMIDLLRGEGIRFVRDEGYSDYYAGVSGYHGGVARGRALECDVFDARQLGPWQKKMRGAFTGGIVVFTGESARAQLVIRTVDGARVFAKILRRTIGGILRGEDRLTNGAALVASLLRILIEQSVPVWTETALTEVLVEDGEVVGALLDRRGKPVRVRARGGVLLSTGGFSHNRQMREQYSGEQPNSGQWTHANPGDTGEAIELAMKLGAATDLMDEAWWIPTAIRPDGTRIFVHGERCKPGCIIVDSAGHRYFNEAVSYMEAGQLMYKRDREVPAVPSWLIFDSRYRRRYPLALRRPGLNPEKWKTEDFVTRADSLAQLADVCGLDEQVLESTVQRFNGFAVRGSDDDFHRGEGDHERWYGDVSNKPNPCLGPIDAPPFYAVALYPGDVGTSGGLLCDERSRVLDTGGNPIAGLYASGNATASVMGRTYPGAGASIAASMIFSYIAANDAGRRAQAG
ncbi:MAG: FAD-binding protein [Acidimicrobiales bacterium]